MARAYLFTMCYEIVISLFEILCFKNIMDYGVAWFTMMESNQKWVIFSLVLVLD